MIYLVMALFALAVFDARLTSQRITSYGVQVEMNPLIRALATLLGPEIGSVIGVGIPVALQITVCVLMGWQLPLMFLIGYRTKLAINQYLSIQIEKKIKEIESELARRVAEAPATPPPSLVDLDESTPPGASASSQKDKDNG